MSTRVCRAHRRTYCDVCRDQSRRNYDEDFASNLFTTIAATSSSWGGGSDSSGGGSGGDSSCGGGGE